MIEVRGLVKTFTAKGGLLGRGPVRAVRGVDVTIPDGGAVSLIGESGSGKTTIGRILAGLETYDSGTFRLDGTDVASLRLKDRETALRVVQLIHQDPYSALNPTHTVEQTLRAPLAMRARQTGRDRGWVAERAREILTMVGLDPRFVLPKYPHQLSGGQRQRVVIGRSLTVDPKVLVADEAVSMIDVSLRLGILSLLRDLRARFGISVLYITHDVATARYIGEGGRVYVMYQGEIIERGPIDTVIGGPLHPYTQCLFSAVPVMRGLEEVGPERLEPTAGPEAVVLDALDHSCSFAPRCPFATDRCANEHPVLEGVGSAPGEEHLHACWYPQARQVVASPVARRSTSSPPVEPAAGRDPASRGPITAPARSSVDPVQ